MEVIQVLKIKDIDSLLKIVTGLLNNGYEIKIKIQNQEWPRENYFDYYQIDLIEKVSDDNE